MYKFFAFLDRMKYINRWSLMHSTKTENIAEHSLQVAQIAHALATISNLYFDGKVDANSVAVKAVFHETSEVLTGDLPTPIKYFNPAISTAYKALEAQSNQKLLSHLPDQMQEVYQPILCDHDDLEYKFVKYADKISAYVKCIDELKLSNKEFVKAKDSILQEINNFKSPEVDFFMENFVTAYQLSLDELD
ncbi:MAG: 5'-deoxynucleotidase [Clostridia bacterium]|nr:5'-deoxynucleotidase [Clostridia bacterium]